MSKFKEQLQVLLANPALVEELNEIRYKKLSTIESIFKKAVNKVKSNLIYELIWNKLVGIYIVEDTFFDALDNEDISINDKIKLIGIMRDLDIKFCYMHFNDLLIHYMHKENFDHKLANSLYELGTYNPEAVDLNYYVKYAISFHNIESLKFLLNKGAVLLKENESKYINIADPSGIAVFILNKLHGSN